MMGLTLAVIPFLNTAAEALITAFGFGLGFGIVMPNVYDTLADLASCDRRATLLALGTGTASLGQFLSPILLGAVWEAGTKNVFFVATAIALLLAILQLGSPSYPSKTTD
jgi:MFS family permease